MEILAKRAISKPARVARPFPRLMRYRMLLALPWLCAITPAFPAGADERQYKVEAAFLYNFFNYITWPGYGAPEELKQVTLCIHGEDPIQRYLEYVQRKMSDERALNLRRIPPGEDPEGCHMLFIRGAVSADFQRRFPSFAQKGVLVVSDTPRSTEDGGMIGLVREGERIAIDVQHTLLTQANFQVSSRLLHLARRVK